MSRPRDEPHWPEVRVGDRQHGGVAIARLLPGTPALVQVQVAQMASATVDISVEDAVALWKGLGRLLLQAGVQLPAIRST